MNNGFSRGLSICFYAAVILTAAKFSGIWEDLSFPAGPEAVGKDLRKFLFKFLKSFG
jgi:hypothetical protein